ncbi:YchJ family protein [Deinococcus hohokamensis]|uniref:UPF0225 protein ACFO0D_13480 n=1 Tax=Deinococcus hohokamensis TaxID=309883 RepID=A0ABV9IAI4_9DEIO
MPLPYPSLKPCPCGSGRSYAACCEPAHRGAAPETPEALMRSRYAAYVLQDEAYLLASWHPETRPGTLDLSDGTRYLGLRVYRAQGDEVTFTATLRLPDGHRAQLRERSTFARLDGRWVYVDGVTP